MNGRVRRLGVESWKNRQVGFLSNVSVDYLPAFLLWMCPQNFRPHTSGCAHAIRGNVSFHGMCVRARNTCWVLACCLLTAGRRCRYTRLLGTDLAPPLAGEGEERLQQWPQLVPCEVNVQGGSWKFSATDIAFAGRQCVATCRPGCRSDLHEMVGGGGQPLPMILLVLRDNAQRVKVFAPLSFLLPA